MPAAAVAPVYHGSPDLLKASVRTTAVVEGARPAWSPDGRFMAYVDHEFGTVRERELATGATRCLTCHVPGGQFWRVHYTAAGDLLLGGRGAAADPSTPVSVAERLLHLEWYWMPRNAEAQPFPLHLNVFEGIAVARHSDWIAWTATPFHHGQDGQRSAMWIARLRVDGKVAVLEDRRQVLEWPSPDSGVVPPTDFVAEDPDRRLPKALPDFGIEAQDFIEGGKGDGTPPAAIVFYAFAPDRRGLAQPYQGLEIYRLDLRAGRVQRQTDNDEYDEAEGVTPDGRFVVVESDHDTGLSNAALDLYALRLDGTGRHLRRLTYATAQPGSEATNPVISPDGRSMLHELHSADGTSSIQLTTFVR
ncbi:translocation protein TolB [Streptomyces pristinaespiralis]|nr:translocation protein TolB [Streptomyces pristinaespiralis]